MSIEVLYDILGFIGMILFLIGLYLLAGTAWVLITMGAFLIYIAVMMANTRRESKARKEK